MADTYLTSLYVAKKTPEQRFSYPELYAGLVDFLNNIGINCIIDSIDKNGQKINKYIIKVPNLPGVIDPKVRIKIYIGDYRINLTFIPSGNNVSKWQTQTTIGMVNEVLKLTDKIGDSFALTVNNNSLKFERQILQDAIDISDWNISINNGNVLEKQVYNLSTFLENRSIYNPYNYVLNETISFYVYSTLRNDQISKIIEVLKRFGDVSYIENNDIISWFNKQVRTNYKKIIIIIDSEANINDKYSQIKDFFISKGIPTQFIRTETIYSQEFKYKKRDVITQILIKSGYIPIELDWPLTDPKGSLVIDTSDPNQKIIGMLYISQDRTEKECFTILSDVKYKTSVIEEGKVIPSVFSFDDTESENKLIEHTVSFIGREGLSIDLILTRKWSTDNLSKLVSNLSKKSRIEVKNIYFVSTEYMRFVSGFNTISNHSSVNIPYIIKGSQALIFISTKPSVYSTIFPVYIKKMDGNNQITEDDIKKFIWFSKKRLYRLTNFEKLKEPEQIQLLHRARQLNIENERVFNVSDLI